MERTVTDTDKRDTDKILKIFEGSVTLYNRRSRERVTLYRPAKKKRTKEKQSSSSTGFWKSLGIGSSRWTEKPEETPGLKMEACLKTA